MNPGPEFLDGSWFIVGRHRSSFMVGVHRIKTESLCVVRTRPSCKPHQKQRTGLTKRPWERPRALLLDCDVRGCDAGALLDPGLDRGRPAGVSDQAVDELAASEQAEGGDAHHAAADGGAL